MKSLILICIILLSTLCIISTTTVLAAEETKTPCNADDASCWAQQLSLNPTNIEDWISLAASMKSGEVVTVGDEEILNSMEAMSKSVTLQPANATLWTSLAYHYRAADPKEQSIFVDGKRYSSVECVQKALELDPKLTKAWVTLVGILRHMEREHKSKNAEKGKDFVAEIEIQGNNFNARQAINKIFELDFENSGAWVELGKSLNKSPTETATVTMNQQGGEVKQFTRRQCYENAVKYNDQDFLAWTILANDLMKVVSSTGESSSSTKVVDSDYYEDEKTSKKYDSRACLLKSLEIEPSFGLAYSRLADSMDPDAKKGSSGFSVEVNDEKFTKKQLYEKALTLDPSIGSAWINLAGVVGEKQRQLSPPNSKLVTAKVSGKEYNMADMLEHGLNMDPNFAIAWVLLGQKMMKPTDKISVRGKDFNRQQCFEEALALQSDLVAAWAGLGGALASLGPQQANKNPVTLRGVAAAKNPTLAKNGVTAKDCFRKAISLRPDVPSYFTSLAALMATNDETVTVALPSTLAAARGAQEEADGGDAVSTSSGDSSIESEAEKAVRVKQHKKFTAIDLLLHAIELQPQAAEPLGFLAQRMHIGKIPEITLPASVSGFSSSNNVATPRQLLIKSLESRPQIGIFWFTLGGMMKPDETIEISGKNYAQFDCLIQSLTYQPTNHMAWTNLALVLKMRKEKDGAESAGKIQINGKEYDIIRCFERSLELKPEQDRVFLMLTDSMSDTDFVTIRGRPLSKKDILKVLKPDEASK